MSEKAVCQVCGEPMPPGEEMFNFHGYSGPCPKPPLPKPKPLVKFYRESNGDVTVEIKNGWGELQAKETIEQGHWISNVLNMSSFGERPGDYHAWLKHHAGEKDILEGQRGGY